MLLHSVASGLGVRKEDLPGVRTYTSDLDHSLKAEHVLDMYIYLYIYIYKYMYMYIYIYTRFLGPPKAGHTNEPFIYSLFAFTLYIQFFPNILYDISIYTENDTESHENVLK